MIYPLITAAAFFTDQYLKKEVEEREEITDGQMVLDDKIIVRKVKNEGLAFGTLSEYGWIAMGLNTIAVVLTASAWFGVLRKKGLHGWKLGASLLLAGGLSNLYDRMTRGYVVDYFSVKCKNEKFEKIAFNLGDLFVFIGGLLALLSTASAAKQLKGEEGPTEEIADVDAVD